MRWIFPELISSKSRFINLEVILTILKKLWRVTSLFLVVHSLIFISGGSEIEFWTYQIARKLFGSLSTYMRSFISNFNISCHIRFGEAVQRRWCDWTTHAKISLFTRSEKLLLFRVDVFNMWNILFTKSIRLKIRSLELYYSINFFYCYLLAWNIILDISVRQLGK